MLVYLKSNNKKLSYLIKKNPESPMLLKSIRKGIGAGWYSSLSQYNIKFFEGNGKSSYCKDPGFIYQNHEQFNSPLFIINAVSNFIDAPIKKELKDDIVSDQEFYISMVKIYNIDFFKMFFSYFTDFNIEIEKLSNINYALKIKSKSTISKLLHFVNLLSLMLIVKDKNSYFESSNGLEKYLKSVNELNAPYFIRYLFKTNLLYKAKDFHKYKHLLENDNIKLEFGNTQLMRRDSVKSKMDFSYPIVDVGCGEGFYLKEITKISNKNYHGIDIDPNELNKSKELITENEITNALLYQSLHEYNKSHTSTMDYLLVEVMEHMPINKAKSLIKDILNNKNCNSLIVTTPNKEFNKNYLFNDDQMRHHDHDFELTYDEFKLFIKELNSNYSLEFFEIGDTVEGITPSVGVKLSKEKGVNDD